VDVLAGALLPVAAAVGASLAALGGAGRAAEGGGAESRAGVEAGLPEAPSPASQAAYLAFARGGAGTGEVTDWDDVEDGAEVASGEGPGESRAVAASGEELWAHLEGRISRSDVGAAPRGPSPPLALAALSPAARRTLLRCTARGLRSALDADPEAPSSMAGLAGRAVRSTLDAFLPAVAAKGTRPRPLRAAVDAAAAAAAARFAAAGETGAGAAGAAGAGAAVDEAASPFGAKDGPYAALCRHLAVGSGVEREEGEEGEEDFDGALLSSTAFADALLVDRYAELLLDDLVVSLADATVTALLACALELEACGVWGSVFGGAGLRSSRDIERLRNRVAWDALVRRCLSDPVAVYEDRVTCWGLTAGGLAAVRVRHSRKRELRALGGVPLAVTLFLEAQDVAAPILRDVLERLGGLVSFLLVSLIGRSLGLVYRGILESARQGQTTQATAGGLPAPGQSQPVRPLDAWRQWAARAVGGRTRWPPGPAFPA